MTAFVIAFFPRGPSHIYISFFFFTFSAILIRVATIGYAREPDFEVHSSHELSIEERIAWALLNRQVFKDACEKERIDLRFAKKVVERFERRHRGEEEEKGRTDRKTKGKL